MLCIIRYTHLKLKQDRKLYSRKVGIDKTINCVLETSKKGWVFWGKMKRGGRWMDGWFGLVRETYWLLYTWNSSIQMNEIFQGNGDMV